MKPIERATDDLPELPWLVITDQWSRIVEYSNHAGRARDALVERLDQLRADGWTLEHDLRFNTMFCFRGLKRICVGLIGVDPETSHFQRAFGYTTWDEIPDTTEPWFAGHCENILASHSDAC